MLVRTKRKSSNLRKLGRNSENVVVYLSQEVMVIVGSEGRLKLLSSLERIKSLFWVSALVSKLWLLSLLLMCLESLMRIQKNMLINLLRKTILSYYYQIPVFKYLVEL